jgi:hypothetical protein
MIILPLQARDKHRESTQKNRPLSRRRNRSQGRKGDSRRARTCASRRRYGGRKNKHTAFGAPVSHAKRPFCRDRLGTTTSKGTIDASRRRRRSLSFRRQVARLAKTESFGLRRHLSCLADLKRQHPPTVPVDGKLQVRAGGGGGRGGRYGLFFLLLGVLFCVCPEPVLAKHVCFRFR